MTAGPLAMCRVGTAGGLDRGSARPGRNAVRDELCCPKAGRPGRVAESNGVRDGAVEVRRSGWRVRTTRPSSGSSSRERVPALASPSDSRSGRAVRAAALRRGVRRYGRLGPGVIPGGAIPRRGRRGGARRRGSGTTRRPRRRGAEPGRTFPRRRRKRGRGNCPRRA